MLSRNVGKSNVAPDVPEPGTQQNGAELLANLVGPSERLDRNHDRDPSLLQVESEPASSEEIPSSSNTGYEPKVQDMIIYRRARSSKFGSWCYRYCRFCS